MISDVACWALLLVSFALGFQISAARKLRRELEAAARDRARSTELAVKERAAAMRLQVQLGGCGVAALGGLGPDQLAKKGQYGWSPAYQDVVDARRELEALRFARDHALAILTGPVLGSANTHQMAVDVLEASKEAAVLMRADREA